MKRNLLGILSLAFVLSFQCVTLAKADRNAAARSHSGGAEMAATRKTEATSGASEREVGAMRAKLSDSAINSADESKTVTKKLKRSFSGGAASAAVRLEVTKQEG